MCFSFVNKKFKYILEGNPQREQMAESELLTTSAASPNKLCKMSYPLLTTSWTLFSYLIRRKFYSNFKSCLIALFSRIYVKAWILPIAYLLIFVPIQNVIYIYYLNTSRRHFLNLFGLNHG